MQPDTYASQPLVLAKAFNDFADTFQVKVEALELELAAARSETERVRTENARIAGEVLAATKRYQTAESALQVEKEARIQAETCLQSVRADYQELQRAGTKDLEELALIEEFKTLAQRWVSTSKIAEKPPVATVSSGDIRKRLPSAPVTPALESPSKRARAAQLRVMKPCNTKNGAAADSQSKAGPSTSAPPRVRAPPATSSNPRGTVRPIPVPKKVKAPLSPSPSSGKPLRSSASAPSVRDRSENGSLRPNPLRGKVSAKHPEANPTAGAIVRDADAGPLSDSSIEFNFESWGV
ncbi:hypothetical protein B0H15DRAFT_855303 [Mycena belliarum]|uniref:Uncharacterized protein n=1 Tax=Mycena belliarum TaxID=1033014 RepID=A0AAD6TXT6_9AGAR|nr:hypothetical protein B0H15DRAFT_855303 [Mycena belliae]